MINLANDETSRLDGDLTDGQESVQESTDGSIEPQMESKEKAGFQKAIQDAREREKAKEEALSKAQQEIAKLKRAQQDKELADMSEVERLAKQLEQERKSNAEFRIKSLINSSIRGKAVPDAIIRALEVVPWEIVPGVKGDLTDDATYDEVIASLERHLPAYVDSITMPNASVEESSDKKIDTERSGAGSSVVKRHIYTRSEVDKIQSSPSEWEKHREAILKQVADNGGVLPE